MRECKKCGKIKPEELFVKSGQYRRRTCKACESKRVNKFYADNPDKYVAIRERKAYTRHGLTLEEYQRMVLQYDGKCWSCQEEVATVIDHDHTCCSGLWSCGKCVRGLLCRGCNLAAGMLLDQPKRANMLAQYLLR